MNLSTVLENLVMYGDGCVQYESGHRMGRGKVEFITEAVKMRYTTGTGNGREGFKKKKKGIQNGGCVTALVSFLDLECSENIAWCYKCQQSWRFRALFE